MDETKHVSEIRETMFHDMDDALMMDFDSDEFLKDIDFKNLPDDFFKDLELPPCNGLSSPVSKSLEEALIITPVSLDHSSTDKVFNKNLYFDPDELLKSTQEPRIEFSSLVSIDHRSPVEKDEQSGDRMFYNDQQHHQTIPKLLNETLINTIQSAQPSNPAYTKLSTESVSVHRVRHVRKEKTEHWTEDEHRLFLFGLQIYGRQWTKISRNVVLTRNPSQVASHAQKYFLRNGLSKEERKRKSIHDTTLQDLHTIDQPNFTMRLPQENQPLPCNVSHQMNKFGYFNTVPNYNKQQNGVLAPNIAMQMPREIQPPSRKMPYQMDGFGYLNTVPNYLEQQNWVSHPNHAMHAKDIWQFNLPSNVAFPMGGYGFVSNRF